MSNFDFDRVIDRRDTGSMKWERYRGRDIIPLWVADMDFASPPAVLEALRERIHNGVFGYSEAPRGVVAAVCERLAERHGWTIAPDWLVWLPGLVTGINVACRTAGERGDAILTTTPVYHPFLSAPDYAERQLLRVPLLADGGSWCHDFDALEAAITPRCKMLLLCSPHNPCARVWRDDELQGLAELAERHDLIVCSDEIHCDLVLDPNLRHRSTATLGDAIARRSITLLAASKTFNLPGLGCAYAVIPDAGIRARFRAAAAGIVPHVNALGYAATEAAYRFGEPWRLELIDYLRGNLARLHEALATEPRARLSRVEATYLAWLDLRAYAIDQPREYFEAAGLGLYGGDTFGLAGYVRLNFATPRAIWDEALLRLRRALASAA